jgi:hypothetical protein
MPVIYISYGPSDGTMARLLAADLRTLGAQVALEAADMRFAPTRARVLADPVRRSAIMIVILSPTAAASELVTAEWRYALDHDIPLIPLLHHPTDLPDRLRALPIIDCDSEQYSAALETLHHTLSTHGITLEPVAILAAHYKEEWLADMKTARQGRARPPRDRRLAIAGAVLIALCFVLLVAFFTTVMNPIQPNEDRNLIMATDFALAQGLGWSRIVAEVIVLIIGGFLVARYVSARTRLSVSPTRTAGALILLLAGTVVLHADETRRVELPESVSVQVQGDTRLREQSRALALDEGGGGGWLGHQLYILLRFRLAPAGMTTLLFFAWVLGAVLLTGFSPRRAAQYVKERRRETPHPKERYRKQVAVVPATLPRRREPDDAANHFEDEAGEDDSAGAEN